MPNFRRAAAACLPILLVLTLLAGCLVYTPADGGDTFTRPTNVITSETPAIAPTISIAATPTPTAAVTASATPAASATATPEATASAHTGPWAAWQDSIEAKMPAVLPISQLFAPPEFINPSLSPDGKYLLVRAIAPDHSYDGGVVLNLVTNEQKSLPYPEKVQGIPSWRWAGDSRHVLLSIDNMGDENYGLYSIDIETGESLKLFHEKGVRVDVIDANDSKPNIALIEMNQRNNEVFDLYQVDITTGKLTLVMENPGGISEWLTDYSDTLRAVRVLRADGGEDLLVLKKTGTPRKTFLASDWQTVLSIPYEETSSSQIFGFSTDNKKLYYADTSATDTTALMEMNLQTLEKKKITGSIDFDIDGVWHDMMKNTVTALRYNKDRLTWVSSDADMTRHLANLRSMAQGDFTIVSSGDKDKIWLVSYRNDTAGLSYWIYVPGTGQGSRLFDENPALQGLPFAAMEPITYKASDGLGIHGYATYPVGLEHKDLPMVLLVHGGPQARDDWGFSSEVQFLVNRGYMVLQVNFRGSTGFGKSFINSADKQWGAAMQQDLTDAVNWAVSNGYADPKRISIMGGSYGGYAALAGAAFTPGVYACAIDMFGPSSLITLLNSVPDYWKPMLTQMYRTIGNPKTEQDFLKSRSPLYNVDKIKIPILIAQGGNDVRVKPAESEQIVKALKDRNLPVEYLYFPDAGHGLGSTEDLIAFYTAAEKFLAEHIGGRVGASVK